MRIKLITKLVNLWKLVDKLPIDYEILLAKMQRQYNLTENEENYLCEKYLQLLENKEAI